MPQVELLEELKKLPLDERLLLLEDVLHSVREDLQRTEQPLSPERKRQLAAAAQALLPDYAADSELTAFTVLDSEDFHA